MNLIESKSKRANVGMLKQEAVEVDDILLQHEVPTSKPENVSTDEQLESASLNTFDADEIGNRQSQDCWLGSDHEISAKEELLNEKLDSKSEDEAIQVDEKHNLSNKFHKHPSGVNPFKCNICKNDFECKSALKLHLITHTGEKPFKCNICDYRSGLNRNLKRHLISHTREKPFKCYVCHSSYGHKTKLKRHLITHTGEKPFKCNICDYSSGLKASLKRHLRSHTGEKHFKCNVCDYSCTHNKNLKKHLLTHTGQNEAIVNTAGQSTVL